MNQYTALAVILSFFVDFLLLIGTNRLCGYPTEPWRCALGAGVGALHAGMCMAPGFHFLGTVFWRTVFIGIISAAAFRIVKSALRRGAVFWLLCMALEGVAAGMENLWSLLPAAAGIALLCGFGFSKGIPAERYVPVELSYGGRQVKLMALHDTGNTLFDPLTGQSVLVVGADAAQTLTGLTQEQLRRPVESMGSLPGLRLIPYRTIGKENGFLLGLKLKQVQIGSRCGSRLVAFAPEQLSSEGAYQALTGGTV